MAETARPYRVRSSTTQPMRNASPAIQMGHRMPRISPWPSCPNQSSSADVIDRVAVVRHRERQTAREQQRGQGHDEGRHPSPGDEQPVDQADGATYQQWQCEGRQALAALGRERGKHRGQRQQGATREVDAAADDDERHADGHQAQERAGLDDVQEVVHAREPGPECQGSEQRHHDEHDHGACALDLGGDPSAPGGGDPGPDRHGCGREGRRGVRRVPVGQGRHDASLSRWR